MPADITLTFPDGNKRAYKPGTTGKDVAESIAKSLAKKAVAMSLDGTVADLADPIEKNAAIKFVMREDPEALELIRHDSAHVLAEAVQELWPGTQVTIGPVIENGFYYDFAKAEPFLPEDLAKIEARMRDIIKRNKPFTKEFWSRDQAKDFFRAKSETFKVELVDAIPAHETLRMYKQGEWMDLCRGPHMTATGQIGNAFKLTKIAGSYWRGDSTKAQLQRLYGTAWASEKDLATYLTHQEEAEKRDHKKLGREMDLFHFQDDAPGTVFWHPKGWTLFQGLIGYMRRRQDQEGYVEVNTPQLLDKSLWVTSGHWENYHEHMFVTETEDEKVFALKPMNCPGHVQIFKHGLTSYKQLPIKIAEFGIVHRYEPSGALSGLKRVRAFTQDDAHIFCTDDQIEAESLKINEFMLSIYKDYGFDDVHIKLATRPEKRVGEDALWDKAETAMKRVLEKVGQISNRVKTSIVEGDGAFYGPKFEYHLKDAIGRTWQCGTNQVDFNLPGRFGAFYIDANGDKKTPVMLHRAMFGSLERFTAILIESTGGHFPQWLSPLQAVVAPIVSDADGYAVEVLTELRKARVRAETDLRNEKINYKVREHSLAKVPVMLVVGKREAEEQTVSIRRLGSQEQVVMKLDDAVAMLVKDGTPPDIARAAAKAAG
jgi:threonyl-tRNA synthetase